MSNFSSCRKYSARYLIASALLFTFSSCEKSLDQPVQESVRSALRTGVSPFFSVSYEVETYSRSIVKKVKPDQPSGKFKMMAAHPVVERKMD